MKLYLVSILFFSLVYALLDSVHDYHLDRQHKKTWHILDWLIKAWVFCFLAFTIWYRPALKILGISSFLFMGATIYWWTHDLMCGWLYMRDPFYLGSVNWLDRLDNWNIIIKGICLLVTIYLCLIIFTM